METMEYNNTTIISNGSKWAGEEPDNINELFEVLKSYPLDKSFEDYGNFFYRVNHKDWINPETEFAKEWNDSMHFFGNFKTISHVFNIYTKNQDLIIKLINAIEDNIQREDYKR